MADITAIFGILLLIGIAYPGMLLAWQLLFPNVVGRARTRVMETPWKSFGMGLLFTAVIAVPAIVLIALPVPFTKFLGWIMIGGALALSTLGSAGIAAGMGARLAEGSPQVSAAGALVRGAIALELAVFFPILGWLFVMPFVITAIGATGFALLRWLPKQSTPVVEAVPAQA